MTHLRLAHGVGMRWRVGTTALFLVLSMLWGWSTGQAQDAQPRSTLNDDLVKTYSYVMLQRLLLDKIEKTHPDLAEEMLLTRTAWRAAFGEAEDNLEVRLAGRVGDGWPKFKLELMSRLETAVAGQALPREYALNLLQTTKERTKGIMESPIREMLLASHPRFIKTPAAEMSKGFAGEYSTKGHAKAKGVNMTIRYPLSWKREEASRPNTVQRWTSDGGHGTSFFAIATKQIPRDTLSELKETLFTEESIRSTFPEGTKTIRFAVSKLEQQKVGIYEFESSSERLELTLKFRGILYYFLVDDVLVNVQFMASDGGNGSPEERLEQIRPLVQMIMQSVVLPDRYR
jgi:hypothetical protein